MNWISVKDQLPEEDQETLFFIPGYPGITIGNFRSNYFHDDVMRFDHDNKPTHWMLLPNPPE